MTFLEHVLCDVLPHALLVPGCLLGSRNPERRRKALSAWLPAALLCICAAAALGDIFAGMRAATHVVFVELPIALGAAAVTARRARVAFAAIALIIVAIGVDAFFIEPTSLEIRRHTLTSPHVDRPIRLAIVADLQFDTWGSHEEKAIDAVAAEKPDAVLFAGDYAQHPDPEPLVAQARAYIERALHPPLGMFAVEGNVDRPYWEKMFPDSTAVWVAPEPSPLTRGPLSVTGLPLAASFDPALIIPRAPGFHIVLGHAPDFSLGHIDADLLVAGHTHGGQVQLPFIGPLITFSTVPNQQAAGGLFPREGGHLLISRGVGMERGTAPRLRFLCRPEIVIVDITPAQAGAANGSR